MKKNEKKGISEAGGRLGNWGDRSYGESISRERTALCQMTLLQALGLKPLLIWSRRLHPTHPLAIKGTVWHLLVLNTYIPSFLLLMASWSSLRLKYQISIQSNKDPISMYITTPCPLHFRHGPDHHSSPEIQFGWILSLYHLLWLVVL